MKITIKILILFLIVTSCSKDDDNTAPKSEAKQFVSFSFLAANNNSLSEDITAVINEENKTITATVPYGTNITSLVPTVEVSPGAALSPEGVQDFSNPVIYKVTAENETHADYTLIVNFMENETNEVPPKSEAKQLVSFSFLAANNNSLSEDIIAVINEENKTITATVPYGTDITNLVPTAEVSPGATLSPEGVQDFSNSVIYKVTAENETHADYTLTVNFMENETNELSEKNILIKILNDNPDNTLNWDINTEINEWEGVVLKNGKVSELLLGGKKLTNIPKEIGSLKELTKLNLSSNQLTSIPQEIGNLKNLMQLDLERNQLTSIPKEIGNLKELIFLYLNHNQLTNLPKEIGQLQKIAWLHIDNNKLTSIPKEIGQLTSVNWLTLYENQLTSIPDEIGQCTNLNALYIFKNLLTSIPKEIGNLKNLEFLHINNNQITSIPEEIGQLYNLNWLYINNNKLTNIPSEIGQLKKLSILALNGNQLTSIPQEVCNLNIEKIILDEGVTCAD